MRNFALLALLGLLLTPYSGSLKHAEAQQDVSYTLRPNDIIVVEVFGEPQLSGRFGINASGRVSLPLVGELNASGLTGAEMEQAITDALQGRYLTDPSVIVQIDINQQVHVEGWTNRQGAIAYKPGMTAREAILRAGGFHDRAREDRIFLIRTSDSDVVDRIGISLDTELLPGDIVSVPELQPCYACWEESDKEVTGHFAGNLTWRPSVQLETGYTDNLLRDEPGAGEIDTFFATLSPGLSVDGALGETFTYTAVYEGDFRRYFSSSDDNHENHRVLAKGRYRISSSLDIEGRASYADEHELRGEGLTLGEGLLVEEPIPRQTTETGVLARYTSPGRQFELELDASEERRRYDRFPELTAQRERDISKIAGEFRYRMSPRVGFTVLASSSEIDFLRPNDSDIVQDSSQSRLTAGISWDAFAKTEGVARIGFLKKDFESPGIEDISEPAWDLELTWSPRSYSSVRFTQAREIDDGARASDISRLMDVSELNWRHEWSDRFNTTIQGSFRDISYTGAPNRDDDEYRLGISLGYLYRRNMLLTGSYRYTTRDSSNPDFEFTRNLVSVDLRWEL